MLIAKFWELYQKILNKAYTTLTYLASKSFRRYIKFLLFKLLTQKKKNRLFAPVLVARLIFETFLCLILNKTAKIQYFTAVTHLSYGTLRHFQTALCLRAKFSDPSVVTGINLFLDSFSQWNEGYNPSYESLQVAVPVIASMESNSTMTSKLSFTNCVCTEHWYCHPTVWMCTQ
jgi:hypothetical protein